ncbi:MAG: beta-ketoacyl-ACP synthase [Mesorhizobium sp.]|nr:beta-ketoacyl-ACP synthase [Mesorhizobium sp.]MCO5163822.1 beta-ketoacyl-ACP synthase [Mesorhizobium sp.]
MSARDVVITGIGLVSCLGEGAEPHWKAFRTPSLPPPTDSERFAPYCVHPLPEIDWSLQIPKKGDQRQMETWQRLGVYAAGLALDDAGLKSDEALCATMDMIVAAGGGERDEEVDETILEASLARNDTGVLLNEKLTNDLRPTLFLAQLSNLMAGNISIVHKITGSSRTFMGEEGAGVSALQTAVARLASGQSTHILVGGAFQTEHPDMLLGYELASYLHRGPWEPLWTRDGGGGGIITGSGGAFLVLETREHAEARGGRIYAVIDKVVSGLSARSPSTFARDIADLVGALGAAPGQLLISGASGAHLATTVERETLTGFSLRGFSALTGHLKEAQLPFAVALAAMAIFKGEAPGPLADVESPYPGAPERVLTTAVGHHRGEGAALVRKA